MAKPGRKPRNQSAANNRISIRLTDAEKELIDKRALSQKSTTAEYIRQVVLLECETGKFTLTGGTVDFRRGGKMTTAQDSESGKIDDMQLRDQPNEKDPEPGKT
jgi:hypothetical protein